ncbi:L,D-transpeptidase [Streptomyces chiangmaiensis]
MRRRLRRTAGGIAGASAATALGVVVLLGLTGPDTPSWTSPAAIPTSVPSTRTGPAVTVDLTRRTLTIDGRELPVTAGTVRTRTPTGRMTVTALAAIKTVSGKDVGLKGAYGTKIPWVVELRAGDGTRTYLGGLVYDAKAPGHYDVTSGWIGLNLVNAKWLQAQLRVGDVVEIKDGGRAPDPLRGPTSAGGASAGPTPSGTASFFGGTGTP